MSESGPAHRTWWYRWRPYTDQLGATRAGLITLMSLFRRGRREIWIGDSHAGALLVGPSWAIFLAGPRGELILRAGARLMYSLARKGFPAKVTRFATLVGLLGRRDSFAPVFVAGEIDVRNALPAHPGTDYGFVASYVAQARSLADRMKASQAYIVVPPPPRPAAELDSGYPSVGTDAERLAVFHELRAALVDATRSVSGVTLVDLTSDLSGRDGMLRPEFTDDGCHTNAVAHPVIRTALAARAEFRTGQR